MDRVAVISKKFEDQFIKINREWVEGCVSWSVAEEPSISIQSLYKRTHDQWLLADLKEVGLPCLPDSLFSERKDAFEITGNYILQMNYVLDIAESPYDQLRILHNRILDATDEEKIEARLRTKKNRMLKLELTDGFRTISAIEHRPISSLSTKLVPGCKVLLRGPLKCINKVLFLTPPNISILGGELDTLLIINAYENVLLRKLNKPTKTNPITDYIEPSVAENYNDSRRTQTQNNSRPANFDKLPEIPVDPFDDPMDDDMMICETLARVEQREQEKNSQSSGAAVSSGNSVQEERMRELLPDFHDFIDTSMLLNDEDPFDLDAIQQGMEGEGRNEIFQPKYEFQFESSHLSTIDQIQEKEIEAFLGKTMIVKAKFDTVVEKLKFVGNEATMSITVRDSWSRGKLRVQISTEVMDSLLIYDTKELKEMFQKIQKQPQIRDEIQVALEDLKQKIQNLNSFIKVNYSGSEGFVLIEILKCNSTLSSVFTGKIKKERLVVVR